MAVKGFRGVLTNQGAVLVAVLLIVLISVLTCIGVVYAKAGGRITLLSTTVTKTDNSEPILAQSGGWQTVRMRVTAYCPCERCCGSYSDGKTACGYEIRPDDAFVAADKKYSFGTEMLITGYNNAEPVKVLDRGGAIHGNRLDVFFASHKEALKWGVRYLDVKVRQGLRTQ
ncbi:MAG: 3D domain-containing protein [Planctomycetota bacterium]|jgi:3D (Asp-Asp-Asp) domain-containing protein